MKSYKETMSRPCGFIPATVNWPIQLEGIEYDCTVVAGIADQWGWMPTLIVANDDYRLTTRLWAVSAAAVQRIGGGSPRYVPASGHQEIDPDTVPAVLWSAAWWRKD